jgi:hypothetical protein
MTVDLEELGKRAVACQGWKWLPGMLGWRTNHKGEQVRVRFVESVEDQELVDPRVHERKPSNTLIVASGHVVVDGWHEVSTILPDLRDPATLGCLLQLVRDAWGDDRAYLCDFEGYDSVEWGVVSKIWDEKRNEEGPKAWFSCLLGDGPTEAEALVYALEKAPSCKGERKP